jgi:mRNA interferase MazF
LRPWEVYFAGLDPVVGNEQAGDRPVVIVSSPLHLRLMGGRLLSVLPMTTSIRPWPHRVTITIGGRPGQIMTEQVRTIARERVRSVRPIYELTTDEIDEVTTILRSLLP